MTPESSVRETSMHWTRAGAVSFMVLAIPLTAAVSRADGVSVVKTCEIDTDRPDDVARLAILPNGEMRGSDTAADLVKMARQKAKEGKDAEAIRWATFCSFSANEQAAIKRDSAAVLQYPKRD
jgi:hypothetical protein